MSLHSYSRLWIHLTWATLERRRFLQPVVAAKLSDWLTHYSAEKQIYMKINFANPDHVHTLVDLPASLCVAEMVQFFKGASSHWINETGLVPGKFAWGRGYGAFSVSHSGVNQVVNYIATQEEHHRQRSFAEELRLFVERYGLEWNKEENR
jgi:REP element-mobilizing transposase RayT